MLTIVIMITVVVVSGDFVLFCKLNTDATPKKFFAVKMTPCSICILWFIKHNKSIVIGVQKHPLHSPIYAENGLKILLSSIWRNAPHI